MEGDFERTGASGAADAERHRPSAEAGRHSPPTDSGDTRFARIPESTSIPVSASVDGLPPDLRAVLGLLLTRRRGYAEIAGLLHIEERAVRDRAHAALAMLAPREARALTAAQRERVGEHMLGQADPATERVARAELESSVPARAWARALAAALGTLAAEPLPAIPAEAPSEASPATVADVQPDAPPAPTEAQPASAEAPPPPAGAPPAPAAPISRRGGMAVLGAIAAVVVAVVLIVTVGAGGGGSHPSGSAKTTSTGTGTTGTKGTTSTSSSGLHLSATLPLTSPDPASKAVGVVDVATSHGALGFIVAAEHLPPTTGFHYAAWLYNSPSEAVLLGVGPTVSSNGTLKAIGLLPSGAAHYRQIVLTEEHSEKPSAPGTIVLSGAFKTS